MARRICVFRSCSSNTFSGCVTGGATISSLALRANPGYLRAELLALVQPVVSAYLKEIGGELAGRDVAVAQRPETQKRLLHAVVGLCGVGDQRGEETPQRSAIPQCQGVKRGDIACLCPYHQFVIGRFHRINGRRKAKGWFTRVSSSERQRFAPRRESFPHRNSHAGVEPAEEKCHEYPVDECRRGGGADKDGERREFYGAGHLQRTQSRAASLSAIGMSLLSSARFTIPARWLASITTAH